MNYFTHFFSGARHLEFFSVKIPFARKLRDRRKSEALFRFFARAGINFTLEAAAHHVGNDIHFYLSVPSASTKLVRGNIERMWPGTHIEKAHGGDMFYEGAALIGAYLAEKSAATKTNQSKPKKGGDEAGFLTALNMFSKLHMVGEGMAMQIVAHPEQKHGRLRVNVRFLASAPSEARAEELLQPMSGAFQSFRSVKTKQKKFFSEFHHHLFNPSQSFTITERGLSDIFYL